MIMNTDFIEYIKKIETDYPLDYTLTKGCFLISNSGRRGLAKEFYLEEKIR